MIDVQMEMNLDLWWLCSQSLNPQFFPVLKSMEVLFFRITTSEELRIRTFSIFKGD
jgi:hypothetical protein